MLRASFERHGYRPEYPIVAREGEGGGEALEIVCGVGRYTVALERGMRRVPVVIRGFSGDSEALVYAVEDNLFSRAAAAPISTVHAIVLAWSLEAWGEKYSAKRMREALRVSESTYWRAVGSLDVTLKEVIARHPELEGMDVSRQVATIIRRGLCPSFTRFFSGEVEVNTYHSSRPETSNKAVARPPKAAAPPPNWRARKTGKGKGSGNGDAPSLFDLT
ncbi:MAG: ParB N-terminal domain-containing protein [Acidobacteriota bacterium]|nr:ParB N-terminal domain-containing protein [Acidobacteriota bacterium]